MREQDVEKIMRAAAGYYLWHGGKSEGGEIRWPPVDFLYVWKIQHTNNYSFCLKTAEADQWVKLINIIIINVIIIIVINIIISSGSSNRLWEKL